MMTATLDIPKDKWGLWLVPFEGSRTARRLLKAAADFGWEHNGKTYGNTGTAYTFKRPWQRGETEIIQIGLHDGHWSARHGYASWWTVDLSVAVLEMARGRHWLECDSHYREPSRHLDRLSEVLAVIERPHKADFPFPSAQVDGLPGWRSHVR